MLVSTMFFNGCVFVVSGKFSVSQGFIKSLITDNGGKVVDKWSSSVTHLCTSIETVTQATDKVQAAQAASVPMVSLDFIEQCVAKGMVVPLAPYLLGSAPPVSGKQKAPPAAAAAAPAAKKAKAGTKAAAAAAAAAPASDSDSDDDSVTPVAVAPVAKTKTAVRKGNCAVDAECPLAPSTHVLEQGKEVWDALLNQTDISGDNNKNKFYVLQLLQSDTSANAFTVWTRYGFVSRF